MSDERQAGAEPVEARVIPAALGVTAIVGHSDIGPVGEAVACQSESEFNRHFGDFAEAPTLATAVHGFFQNGGLRCVIINLGDRRRPLRPTDLEPLDQHADIELVCAPGKLDAADFQALLAHAAGHKTRLALLDGPEDLSRSLARLQPPAATHQAALYVPWLIIHDPIRAEATATPPSGFMAGLMARVALERGPHKAPANEALFDVLDLAHHIDQAEQGILYPRRINCIRKIRQLDGFRPWSAQTLSPHGPFQSIGPFRVYAHVVRSLSMGCPWLAGEVNDPELWARLTDAVSVFLGDLWAAGSLAGETDEEAFRVRCDAELNDHTVRDRQQVALQVGLALERPNVFYTFDLTLALGGEDP